MSTFVERDIACPHCGKSSRRNVAESLNLGRSPHLAEPILDGSFQTFRCESCNQQVVIDHPMMVIDFDRRWWLAHYPRAWEQSWEAGERHSDATYQDTMVTYAPPIVAELREGLQRRVVYGLDALREKLVAWGAGLDDRWLELVKLDAWRAEPRLAFRPDARPRLFAANDATLDFWATSVEGTAKVLRVERVRYEATRETADVTRRAFVAALSEGSYVDLARIAFEGEAGPSAGSNP